MLNFTPDLITLTENGHTFYSHPSLMDETRVESIKKIQSKKTSLFRTCVFLSFYGSLEAVNRIGALKSLAFAKRAGFVVVAPLIVGPTVSYFLNGMSGTNTEFLKQFDGAPLYKNKVDVPELDKMYFFLDDDNGYEPSIYYHGS